MKIGELITKSETTGQFRLIDVFGVVTFVAVLLATLTPLLRLIDRENLTLVVTPAAALQVLIHSAVVMLALAYAIYQRKRLQKQAGRRFGVAFCGPTTSEYGPRMKSILTLIGLTCLQLVFVVTQFWSHAITMPRRIQIRFTPWTVLVDRKPTASADQCVNPTRRPFRMM